MKHRRYKENGTRLAYRQRGLSLVELLIALALSTTLILGIFTVYMDSNQTSRLGTSLARIQESARISTDIMARDLRMVGFQGCADPGDVTLNVIAKNPPTTDFFATALRGWEVADGSWADGTEFDDTPIESDALEGSDVLAVQRGEAIDVEIDGDETVSNANIKVKGPSISEFSKNDMVMVSDCEDADLFRITSDPDSGTWAHASNVNTANRLSKLYAADSAQVFGFSSAVYFVADTGRDDAQGNDIRALYRATNNLAVGSTTFQVDEIVEGVESMQIEYGELLASNNVRYETADEVDNMAAVVAVRIGLLISDTDNVRNDIDTSDYRLPGETVVPATETGDVTHPEDSRLRRSFISTIMLRNRD